MPIICLAQKATFDNLHAFSLHQVNFLVASENV
jgi:hypothetical protein